MDFSLTFDDEDVRFLQDFVASMDEHPFVALRRNRNLQDDPDLSPASIWHAAVSCLLTTQQKSGANSPVSVLINERPFPLALEPCQTATSVSAFCLEILSGRRGIRMAPKLSHVIEKNSQIFAAGFMGIVSTEASKLREACSKDAERSLARRIAGTLVGFGPKQARNLLQMLGTTRFEIPLDSRVMKWLKKAKFPVPLSAIALSDGEYYEFVLDSVQIWCDKAGVVPAILDACIFASFEKASDQPYAFIP